MKYVQKYFYLILGLFAFLVYLTTLAPSLLEIDSGELAAVQLSLGIAHPTGYPLFTILGYLLSFIPLSASKIYQVNLYAAISCAAGISIFAYTCKIILENIDVFATGIKSKKSTPRKEDKKDKKKGQPVQLAKEKINGLLPYYKYTAIVFGTIILAFCKTYWEQSNGVEVYSLHAIFINLAILWVLKAYIKSRQEPGTFNKYWFYFAGVLALCFSNHMTTILILPAIAYLYFSTYKINSKSIKQIGLMLLVFFPILALIYAYLPIRSAQNPLLNWGQPTNIERLLRHISGKQYQVWMFSSTEAAQKQLSYFISNLPSELYLGLLVSLAGIIYSFIKSRKFFWFFIISFLFTIAYVINYDIKDIDSYFLLSYIALGFFAVIGIYGTLVWLNANKNALYSCCGVLLVFCGIEFYYNQKETDKSDIYTFEDYTKSILNTCSHNSTIFSYEWDYFLAGTLYYQNIEHLRTDVTVIDKELLRRSWYFNQLNTNHPGLTNSYDNIVEQFKDALLPFERSESFDGQRLETLYRTIMQKVISTGLEKGDVYLGPELVENELQKGELVLPDSVNIVPDLFLYKVTKNMGYVEAPLPNFKIRFPQNGNYYTDFIKNQAAVMLTRRALYELKYKRPDRAGLYVKKIKQDFPDHSLPKELLQFGNGGL